MMNAELYNSLATLLSYPEEGSRDRCHPERSEGSAFEIDNRQSTIGNDVAIFRRLTEHFDLRSLQELFIQTFDLNPVCSLEMGWHLFGENYDRGLLLVKMRKLLRDHSIEENTELPDHITYALRLVPRMQHPEAEYFAEAVVLPALRKMLAALDGKNNPYEHILRAAENLLRFDFPEIQFAAAAGGAELRVLA